MTLSDRVRARLFWSKGITWNWSIGNCGHYGQIMHFSPIDSSFTYCRIYIEIDDWWLYPIVCTAGYQPRVGMKLSLFHRIIFDSTEDALGVEGE